MMPVIITWVAFSVYNLLVMVPLSFRIEKYWRRTFDDAEMYCALISSLVGPIGFSFNLWIIVKASIEADGSRVLDLYRLLVNKVSNL